MSAKLLDGLTPRQRYRRRGGVALKLRDRKTLQLWRQNNTAHFLWLSAKGSAKRRGIEFTIEKHDVVVPFVCPYLGLELHREVTDGGRHHLSPSIDRIDNSKGYVPGNVEVISYLANLMKNQASPEQLVAFANGVLQRFGKTL